jgi:uncharacterized membrane protein YeaQ/YmgE (transglycosylase-associated protein family)
MKPASDDRPDRPLVRFILGFIGPAVVLGLVAVFRSGHEAKPALVAYVAPAVVLGLIVGLLAMVFGRRFKDFLEYLWALF